MTAESISSLSLTRYGQEMIPSQLNTCSSGAVDAGTQTPYSTVDKLFPNVLRAASKSMLLPGGLRDQELHH